MTKRIFAILIVLAILLTGCEQTAPVKEIAVQKVGGTGVSEEVHKITSQKEIEFLETEFKNERWSGIDLYIGTGYRFELNGQDYDAIVHEDNSIEVIRNSSEGGAERAYLLFEQAEKIFEILTGESMTDN